MEGDIVRLVLFLEEDLEKEGMWQVLKACRFIIQTRLQDILKTLQCQLYPVLKAPK